MYELTQSGPLLGPAHGADRRCAMTARSFPSRWRSAASRSTASRCSRPTCATSPSAKQAERVTSELAAVVANSNDAIVGCTLEGNILSWNVGAERIYGYSVGGGDRPAACTCSFRRSGSMSCPQTLTAVRKGESLANYETVRLRKDGRKIAVSLTDSPIRGGERAHHRPLVDRARHHRTQAAGGGAAAIAKDGCRRAPGRRHRARFQQHPHRHPGLQRPADRPDRGAALDVQAPHGNPQSGGFRRFAHAAVARLPPAAAALPARLFSINDTVRNLQKMLQRVIGEQIQIQTALKAEIGRLKADPSQLEQVLLNLCVNCPRRHAERRHDHASPRRM